MSKLKMQPLISNKSLCFTILLLCTLSQNLYTLRFYQYFEHVQKFTMNKANVITYIVQVKYFALCGDSGAYNLFSSNSANLYPCVFRIIWTLEQT